MRAFLLNTMHCDQCKTGRLFRLSKGWLSCQTCGELLREDVLKSPLPPSPEGPGSGASVAEPSSVPLDCDPVGAVAGSSAREIHRTILSDSFGEPVGGFRRRLIPRTRRTSPPGEKDG